MTDFNAIVNSHADAQRRAAVTKSYRGWKVYRGRWPEPEWLAHHPDYDASWEGEEDGWVDNGLSASGDTYEELCDLIDEKQDEWNELNGQFGVGA